MTYPRVVVDLGSHTFHWVTASGAAVETFERRGLRVALAAGLSAEGELAPEALRREWVRKRKGDASEATEELLDAQQSWFEPLTTEEKTHTVHLHTEDEHVAEAVADRIRQHLGMAKPA